MISDVYILSRRNTKIFKNINKLSQIKEIDPDYIIICSRTSDHFRHLKYIESNLSKKIVLIEKPLFNKFYKFDIKFKKFDFLKPNLSVKIPEDSGVLTVTALEQVGKKFKNFLLFLKKNRPSIIVNIEPENYFYKRNLFDISMNKFHKKKGYLSGYIRYLKYLEKKKIVNIILIQRMHFGSEDHESFNLIVWKFKY
jgi:hypothetical protein